MNGKRKDRAPRVLRLPKGVDVEDALALARPGVGFLIDADAPLKQRIERVGALRVGLEKRGLENCCTILAAAESSLETLQLCGAGASLVTVFDSVLEHGLPTARYLRHELSLLLTNRGASFLSEVIGREDVASGEHAQGLYLHSSLLHAGLTAPSLDASGQERLDAERARFAKSGGAAAPTFALRNSVGEETTKVAQKAGIAQYNFAGSTAPVDDTAIRGSY